MSDHPRTTEVVADDPSGNQGDHRMAAVLMGVSPALRGYGDASRRIRAAFDEPVTAVAPGPGPGPTSGTASRRMRRASLGPRRVVRTPAVTVQAPAVGERASQSRRRILENE